MLNQHFSDLLHIFAQAGALSLPAVMLAKSAVTSPVPAPAGGDSRATAVAPATIEVAPQSPACGADRGLISSSEASVTPSIIRDLEQEHAELTAKLYEHLTGPVPMPRPVAECPMCGRTYSHLSWRTLETRGIQHVEAGDGEPAYDLELRNCGCGDTLAIEVRHG